MNLVDRDRRIIPSEYISKQIIGMFGDNLKRDLVEKG